MPVTVTPVTNAVQQSATQTAAILTSSSTVATRLASVSKTIKIFTINSEIHCFYIRRCFIFGTKSVVLFIRLILLGFMWFLQCHFDKVVEIIVILCMFV